MPGTHQNASAEGIALTHTLYGSPVQGIGGTTHRTENIQPAGLHSTAPYRPPKRRKADNPDKLLCSFDGCKAFPIKTTPYCAGHSRKLGLVKWETGGRNPDGSYGKQEKAADVDAG
jgi:hypothetical protein